MPSFSTTTSSGIALDKHILAFGQSGNSFLIKGFNTISPHNGDAVIATFFWRGSTNIIDSVVDVMTDGRHIQGNPYTLVKYVTAGGLSMATYVATNIQNFPDAQADPNPVYAVRADMHEFVSDGGVRLSSWTGVEPNFALALGSGAGAPRSATGSTPGPNPATASAGQIAYNPGALVYFGSASIPSVNDAWDPSFTLVSQGGSDSVFHDDAEYLVAGASGGTANPTFTWCFDCGQTPNGGTWLATSLTLNAPPPMLAPPTNCFIERLPPPNPWLRVHWANSGESGVSTEVSISRNFVWIVVDTVSGVTEYLYGPLQSGEYRARVRHIKTGFTPSDYCWTGSVTF